MYCAFSISSRTLSTPVLAGGVDLQQVDEAAGVDRQAGLAFAARIGTGALLAVQRLGEDARDRGLADAARAGEQEGMVDPAGLQRVGQRAHDVLLPDQFGETLGTPLAGGIVACTRVPLR
jgi:hypothetical protein